MPISEITDVVNKVTFPVYSKFSEDKERLFRGFAKVTIVSSFVALGLGFLIFIFSEQIVLTMLGEKWVAAIPVIRILSLYGILRTIFGNFAPLFLAVGKQDYIAKMTFFRVAALVITIVPLVSMYGLVGAAYSAIISIIVEIPIIIFFALRIFRTNL